MIVRAIERSTMSSISFGEGVVYPLLHGLERDGCLASRRATASGRTRVYYRVTAKGRRHLKGAVTDWARATTAIARIVGRPSYAGID